MIRLLLALSLIASIASAQTCFPDGNPQPTTLLSCSTGTPNIVGNYYLGYIDSTMAEFEVMTAYTEPCQSDLGIIVYSIGWTLPLCGAPLSLALPSCNASDRIYVELTNVALMDIVYPLTCGSYTHTIKFPVSFTVPQPWYASIAIQYFTHNASGADCWRSSDAMACLPDCW